MRKVGPVRTLHAKHSRCQSRPSALTAVSSIANRQAAQWPSCARDSSLKTGIARHRAWMLLAGKMCMVGFWRKLTWLPIPRARGLFRMRLPPRPVDGLV